MRKFQSEEKNGSPILQQAQSTKLKLDLDLKAHGNEIAHIEKTLIARRLELKRMQDLQRQARRYTDPIDGIDDDATRVVEEYRRRSNDPALARYYARIGPALTRAVQGRRSAVLEILGRAADVSTLRLLDLGCGDA